ncbi:MAG: phosphatidate cytidylyltransferase, partial [Bacilli bacterium]|nr:phosphatidate cytidylyltransferase [Bacilli bacterium]
IIPAVYYIFMVDPGVSVVYIMLITALLSIVGQLGDLVFSSIKRHYDIKDFSNIMPGHGGIMDRVDSISFIIMTYIIIKSITF